MSKRISNTSSTATENRAMTNTRRPNPREELPSANTVQTTNAINVAAQARHSVGERK